MERGPPASQIFCKNTVELCASGGILEQEEIPALGHSYTEWETTLEPTKDAEGERTRHCIHCGETQHEPIEKLGRFLGIF